MNEIKEIEAKMGEVFHYTPPSRDYEIPEMIVSIELLKQAFLKAWNAGRKGVRLERITITDQLIEAVNREERDESRIAWLMEERNEDALDRPCILLHFPDGSHLLADGNHRVLAHHRLGNKAFNAILFEQEVWGSAVIAIITGAE